MGKAQWADPPKGGKGGKGKGKAGKSKGKDGDRGKGGSTFGSSDRGRHTTEWRSLDGEGGENDDIDPTRLFVGQFEKGAAKESLHELFEPYGEIEDFKYIDGKGVAYVTYVRRDDAERARASLNESHVVGISSNLG